MGVSGKAPGVKKEGKLAEHMARRSGQAGAQEMKGLELEKASHATAMLNQADWKRRLKPQKIYSEGPGTSGDGPQIVLRVMGTDGRLFSWES